MKTYEFSIIASGLDPSADDFEDRFYNGGCDDALVSFQRGHIIVDFARDAESVDEAISSAIEHVRDAGAKVDRIEPDPLVNLSEIASRAGVTRSAASFYANGKRGKNFPAPVAKVTTDSPLWNWATVAQWFVAQDRLSQDDAIEAEALQRVNDEIAFGAAESRERLEQCA